MSDGLWHRQFGADPQVLGRRILVDEDAYTIVGVMPPDFRHPGQALTANVEFWAAAGFKANPFPTPPSRARRFVPGALARLKSGLTVQQAQQRLDAFVAELSRSYPMEYPAACRWSRCASNRSRKAGPAACGQCWWFYSPRSVSCC